MVVLPDFIPAAADTYLDMGQRWPARDPSLVYHFGDIHFILKPHLLSH